MPEPETNPFEPKQVHEIPTERQIMVARFEPEGRVLVTAGYDGLIRRWNFSSGEQPTELEPLAGHHGWIEHIAFPVHNQLVSADSWGRLRCWQFDAANPAGEWRVVWEHERAHDGWIRGLEVSLDGSRVVTGGKDRIARVWNAENGDLVRAIPARESEVYAVAIHPDGTEIATADLYGVVEQWREGSDEPVRSFETELHFADAWESPGVRLLRFADGGRTLIVAGCERTKSNRTIGYPTIQFYDWETAERWLAFRCGDDVSQGYVFDFAWVPHDSSHLAVVTSGQPGKGQLRVHDLEAEEPGKAVFVHTKMSNCHTLAPHPDERRFVVAATNRNSQGNGAVKDKEGRYVGNTSPLHVWEWPEATT